MEYDEWMEDEHEAWVTDGGERVEDKVQWIENSLMKG